MMHGRNKEVLIEYKDQTVIGFHDMGSKNNMNINENDGSEFEEQEQEDFSMNAYPEISKLLGSNELQGKKVSRRA